MSTPLGMAGNVIDFVRAKERIERVKFLNTQWDSLDASAEERIERLALATKKLKEALANKE